uniref:Uncharacterized protein n=1 Tax=Rhizophora mucronata TaxID=61149 RepID=A0A2P2L310_RHIMU
MMHYKILLFYLQLQAFVRQEMERHEFTASLAHQELVFFVVSCSIIVCFHHKPFPHSHLSAA